MWSVHDTSRSWSVSPVSHSASLALPVPLSLPLPHCLQLHLFPSMWQMIAGLFFPRFHATVLLRVLSLCSLFPSVPSQPLCLPKMPFFIFPPAHCQLLIPAQAWRWGVQWGGGQTKCTFMVCERGGKERKRHREREEMVLAGLLLSQGTIVALNCLATWSPSILLIDKAWVTLANMHSHSVSPFCTDSHG